jgi:plastocyanin
MIKAMPERKKLICLVIALDVAVIAVIAFLVIRNRQKIQPAAPAGNQPPSIVLPTRSPEEIKIISQMETKNVEIKDKTFIPAALTIKVHDQVRWHNADEVDYQLKGDGWQSLPLKPSRNFTRSFDQAGTFPYTCSLHPEMKGTVVVK